MQSRQQRDDALDAAQQQQAGEQAAARRRLIEMSDTGQPTPPRQAAPISTKTAGPCCEGRPAGHTGTCWPLGGTHPAS
jgi:hypothetical protein